MVTRGLASIGKKTTVGNHKNLKASVLFGVGGGVEFSQRHKVPLGELGRIWKL